mmetsp:Transcript_17064/g.34531  ORF Transcript_17064/g.34531 Transcript_17064/m.34531 type:complete len:370 (-) Transcript_17064:1693-2802(-)
MQREEAAEASPDCNRLPCHVDSDDERRAARACTEEGVVEESPQKHEQAASEQHGREEPGDAEKEIEADGEADLAHIQPEGVELRVSNVEGGRLLEPKQRGVVADDVRGHHEEGKGEEAAERHHRLHGIFLPACNRRVGAQVGVVRSGRGRCERRRRGGERRWRRKSEVDAVNQGDQRVVVVGGVTDDVEPKEEHYDHTSAGERCASQVNKDGRVARRVTIIVRTLAARNSKAEEEKHEQQADDPAGEQARRVIVSDHDAWDERGRAVEQSRIETSGRQQGRRRRRGRWRQRWRRGVGRQRRSGVVRPEQVRCVRTAKRLEELHHEGEVEGDAQVAHEDLPELGVFNAVRALPLEHVADDHGQGEEDIPE